MSYTLPKSLGAVTLAAFVAACAQSTQPLSPTPTEFASGDAGPNGETLKIAAPTAVSPTNDKQIEGQVTLSWTNVSGTFKTFPVSYEIEIKDASGAVVHTGALGSTAGAQTSVEVSKQLDDDERHTWRVRATRNNAKGPWSAAASFRTVALPEPDRLCSPPFLFSPLDIMLCHRSYYSDGELDHDEFLPFLSGVARSLNLAKVPNGPFGILVKKTGNNCGGYSCDIICSGQGDDQDQYDVLIDESIPNWGTPNFGPLIRVDFCEIK